MESSEESRKDWLRMVFEYHGKNKSKRKPPAKYIFLNCQGVTNFAWQKFF